jgi:ATP-dependent Zn protease
VETAYERAKSILSEHQSTLEGLTTALLTHETIERPAFEALMV